MTNKPLKKDKIKDFCIDLSLPPSESREKIEQYIEQERERTTKAMRFSEESASFCSQYSQVIFNADMSKDEKNDLIDALIENEERKRKEQQRRKQSLQNQVNYYENKYKIKSYVDRLSEAFKIKDSNKRQEKISVLYNDNINYEKLKSIKFFTERKK